MIEADLLNLGFTKINQPDTETNNGYDYYYYLLELTEGITLLSDESDVIVDNNWTVFCFEIPFLKFENVNFLSDFIETINKNLKDV